MSNIEIHITKQLTRADNYMDKNHNYKKAYKIYCNMEDVATTEKINNINKDIPKKIYWGLFILSIQVELSTEEIKKYYNIICSRYPELLQDLSGLYWLSEYKWINNKKHASIALLEKIIKQTENEKGKENLFISARIQLINNLYLAGKYQKVVDLISEVNSGQIPESNFAKLELLLGAALLEIEEYGESIRVFINALECHTYTFNDRALIYYKIGFALLSYLDTTKRARRYFMKSLILNKLTTDRDGIALGYYGLSECDYRLGKYNKASIEINKALKYELDNTHRDIMIDLEKRIKCKLQ